MATSGTSRSLPSASAAASSGHLSPDDYLARIGGGQTTAVHEIWATGHRLYVQIATCGRSGNLMRLYLFRHLVQLCLRHRTLLLGDADADADIEACAICRDASLASHSSHSSSHVVRCCWFHPGAREKVFRDQLRALCDNHAHLFSDDVPLEKLDELFYFC